jgi:hypothetical protein
VSKTIREVVAAFVAAEELDSAVFELETRGFDRAAFSVLATEDTVARALGHRYKKVRRLKTIRESPGRHSFRGCRGWRQNTCRRPDLPRSVLWRWLFGRRHVGSSDPPKSRNAGEGTTRQGRDIALGECAGLR